jgi:hypothetical protein
MTSTHDLDVIDRPELSELYVSKSKSSHIARLSAYLSSRASSGALRPLPDPDIGAHFLAESVAWFAHHRKADPGLALIEREIRNHLRQVKAPPST